MGGNVIPFDRERRQAEIAEQRRLENRRKLRQSIDRELARFSKEADRK